MAKSVDLQTESENAFADLSVIFYKMSEQKTPEAYMQAYEACAAAAAVLRNQAFEYLRKADHVAEAMAEAESMKYLS